MTKCEICEKKLEGRQIKFCSKQCKLKATNFAHKNYKAQQKRGMERKIKLVEMFGGKCQSCGYDKNYSALTFHHRNPSEKETTLDLRKLSNNSWIKIEAEAKKCNLLCFNCHMEHHHPSHIKQPQNASVPPTST
jgi:hypothetical protein